MAQSTFEIRAVTLRRLRSHGQYNNTAVEATALVGSAQTPEEALGELTTWVERQLDLLIGSETAAAEARQRVWELEAQENTLKAHISALTTRLTEVRALFEGMGIPLPARFPTDDIPF